MKKLLAALMSATLLMTAAGCGGGTNSSAEGGKNLTVGISDFDHSNEFCIKLFDGVKDKLEAQGVKVIVVDAQIDLNTQMDQFDNFIAQDVDAIVSMFVDPKGIGPAILAANEADIPVFGMTTTAEEGDYYFIGSDETDMGALEAELLADQLDQNAQIVYLLNELGHDSQIKRSAGFEDKMKEIRPDIKILAQQKGTSVEEAMQVMEDWIVAYPQIDGVAAQTDLGILGAIQALKASNKEAVTISIDGTSEAIQAVANGQLYATIAQDLDGMADKCAEMILGLADGKTYEQENMIPCYAITKDNVNDYL